MRQRRRRQKSRRIELIVLPLRDVGAQVRKREEQHHDDETDLRKRLSPEPACDEREPRNGLGVLGGGRVERL